MRGRHVRIERKTPPLVAGAEQARKFPGQILLDHPSHQVPFGARTRTVDHAGEQSHHGEVAEAFGAHPLESPSLALFVFVRKPSGVTQSFTGVGIGRGAESDERRSIDDAADARFRCGHDQRLQTVHIDAVKLAPVAHPHLHQRGGVDDAVDADESLPEGLGIEKVARYNLALRWRPRRVAHQHAKRRAAMRELARDLGAEIAGGASQKDHSIE